MRILRETTLRDRVRVHQGQRLDGLHQRITRLPGGSEATLLLGGRGAGTGHVRNMDIYSEYLDPPYRDQLIMVRDGSWVLDNIGVYNARNDGIYVHEGVSLLINGLRGSGCARGELVVVGLGSSVNAMHVDIDYLNHELAAGDAATSLSIHSGSIRRVEIGGRVGRPHEVALLYVTVHDSMRSVNPGTLDMVSCEVDCDISYLQPDHTRLWGCRVHGAQRIDFQNRWRRGLGQSVTYRDTVCGGPVTALGVGNIYVDDESVVSIVAIASTVRDRETEVTIYRGSTAVATLAGGDTWASH